MKNFTTILIVIGFCVATVGAAGFGRDVAPVEDESLDADAATGPAGRVRPELTEAPRESGAVPLFVGGLVLLLAGGVLARRAKASAAGDDASGYAEKAKYRELLVAISGKVDELDRIKDGEAPEAEIRAHIDSLLRDEYFDLTSRSEQLVQLIGFDDYTRVWDGVASAERLLARCWSMVTDGYLEEGLAELPHARAHLARAREAMASV